MGQALPWRSRTAPNLGYQGNAGPNVHIEFQYGPMDHILMREQPYSEHQYSCDPLGASIVTSQGSNPQPVAANVWDHSQVPNYPRGISPEAPNRSMAHNLGLQFPLIHDGISAGHPAAQNHATNGRAWPQSILERQRAIHLPDDSGQGNISSFGAQIGNFSTPPVDYGTDQLLLPTPSPSCTAHGSPEAPGSLYEDKMRSYLEEEEPWRPSGVDRGNYKAIHDKRDRSYYYSHGGSISLDHWWISAIYWFQVDE